MSSKYPVAEMRLQIITSLVKEVLERIPGVPWAVVAYNAVAYYNENRDEIRERELDFFERYEESFINPGYIVTRRTEIRDCMIIDYKQYVVNAFSGGRICGVKLSTDKQEILKTLEGQKGIINGIVDSYNDKAEAAMDKFDNLKNEIELLTTVARLEAGQES